MNLDSTNRWLTLAANVGVLAGIIFLAYEIQQNTVASRLEAASNFQGSFAEIEMLIAGNPEFAELLRKGREGEEISSAEELRLFVFYSNVLRQWQFTHFQYLSEALDEDIWRGQRAFLAQVIGDDLGLFNHWQLHKRQYSAAFNEVVESIVVELKSE